MTSRPERPLVTAELLLHRTRVTLTEQILPELEVLLEDQRSLDRVRALADEWRRRHQSNTDIARDPLRPKQVRATHEAIAERWRVVHNQLAQVVPDLEEIR